MSEVTLWLLALPPAHTAGPVIHSRQNSIVYTIEGLMNLQRFVFESESLPNLCQSGMVKCECSICSLRGGLVVGLSDSECAAVPKRAHIEGS